MPKTINRSQAIRDYIEANPGATVPQVVFGLKRQGVRVSPDLVHHVKRASPPTPAPRGGIRFGDLLAAKETADKLGGVEEAQVALGMLEQLRRAKPR